MGASKEQVVCNLKSARRAKGLSQSELAERVGVKRQAIYDLEVGKYVPNTTLALRMSKELGCKVEDLFVLNDSPEEEPVSLVEKTDVVNTRVSVARVREPIRSLMRPATGLRPACMSGWPSMIQPVMRAGWPSTSCSWTAVSTLMAYRAQ